MNPKNLNKDLFIKNGNLNYIQFQASIKLFTDTVWQRSAEENAKGFEFFASLWREKGLKHRGALEGRNIPKPAPKPAPKKEAAPKEEAE